MSEETIKAGGKEFILKPLPIVRMEKGFQAIMNAVNHLQDAGQKDIVSAVKEAVEKNGDMFLNAVVPELKINAEWVRNNLTYEELTSIIRAFLKVNGLPDFFERKAGGAPEKNLQEKKTPSA